MALSKEWYDAEFFDSESETLHHAPSIEYSFYNAVKTGDMEYVIKNCKEDAFIHLEGTGVLSRNTLQNIKYHFVVTTAMITRYCIDGCLLYTSPSPRDTVLMEDSSLSRHTV